MAAAATIEVTRLTDVLLAAETKEVIRKCSGTEVALSQWLHLINACEAAGTVFEDFPIHY